MTTTITALIAAGYRLTAIRSGAIYLSRPVAVIEDKDDDNVTVFASGRVLFYGSDGDGRWVSADQAVARVAVAA